MGKSKIEFTLQFKQKETYLVLNYYSTGSKCRVTVGLKSDPHTHVDYFHPKE